MNDVDHAAQLEAQAAAAKAALHEAAQAARTRLAGGLMATRPDEPLPELDEPLVKFDEELPTWEETR
ncbi:MAG: hypothetical protein ACYDA5_08695 [Vulcanimicrobiaceae bacterium]